MRLATVEQMRALEAQSSADYDLDPLILMEAAGAQAAQELTLAHWLELKRGSAVVVCGPGHNGGDGFVVARHLLAQNYKVRVVAVGEARTEFDQRQRDRFIRQGGQLVEAGALKGASLIVDALFGLGFKPGITAAFSDVIERMNRAPAPKVSLDVPSGLDADTGLVMGAAVRAVRTLTFGPCKPGFYLNDGSAHVGRVRRLSAGFPRALVRQIATTHHLFSARDARCLIPRREPKSHKSNHGHTLVLAGRPGFWGAGALAAESALRAGSGYVTWASFTAPEAVGRLPEALTATLTPDLIKQNSYTAVAIGPGLGHGSEVAEILRALQTQGVPVVCDADAITACVKHNLFPVPANWILTPHAGELGRVLGVEAKTIEQNRVHAVTEALRVTGGHVLLKGFRTVVGSSDPLKFDIINSGNAALAKAGTGDVLTGLIAGLLAQGLSPRDAATTGAYLHGHLADEWIENGQDQIALLAGDLPRALPALLTKLRARAGDIYDL